MQTVKVKITNEIAIKTLQDLQKKHFIKIINEPKRFSPALPGKALSSEEFKNWIAEAEDADTISLKQTKIAWVRKRKRLLKLIN